MKLDYTYLKKILGFMEDAPTHQIWVSELLKNVSDGNEDKFVGHIKILFDFGCVSTQSGKTGFTTAMNGQNIIVDVPYRLTAKGYEFLDVLKNDTILNQIKDFAISNAWEIGKQMLVGLATNKLS